MPKKSGTGGKVSLRERRKLLRDFRRQYGITLDDLGKKAELSKAMLSRFEAGNRDLSAEAWTRVLDAMGKLLVEDDAKRKAEIAKAEQTAEKLGAWPNVGAIFSGDLLGSFGKQKSEEQPTFTPEQIKVQDDLLIEMEKSFTKEQVLQGYKVILRERDELKAQVEKLETVIEILRKQRGEANE
jgi:transcriptional regulator with XRE-family HTH domain